MQQRILILGGTTEARELGDRLALRDDMAVTLSLAGRTRNPRRQSVATRSGGFGGITGLVHYLRDSAITSMIDATHPYAATMTLHAAGAAQETGTPLVVLNRPAWREEPGDLWTPVDDATAAVQAIGFEPRRVLLAIGRRDLRAFELAPQHQYLIRSVEPVEPPLTVPRAQYLSDRGPFAQEDELALLRRHAIEVIVAKNSGGAATYGKMTAARALRLPVVLLRRPAMPPVPHVTTVGDAVLWLDHVLAGASERGV